MKNLSFYKFAFIINILIIFSIISSAQNSADIINEDPPENLYVVPIAMATWDPIINEELQSYKVWLNNAFIADVDTNFFQFNEDDLVSGDLYIAEVQAYYNSGFSEKVAYEFEFFPSDSFPGFQQANANHIVGTNNILITWSDMIPMELIKITQNPGAPTNGNYQNFGYAYGVAYDFSDYPDALVYSIEFHHTSWDITGIWDYNIHVIDWVAKDILSTLGPFQTTGDDLWEMGVELGDISTGGADSIAILLEPLGNLPDDAYPCLSSDNSSDPQGSILGNLSDLNSMSPSINGNFLLNTWILTYNGNGKEVLENIVLGANIYLENQLIAFVPEPDTSYIVEDIPPGYYDYCVTKVYTNDDNEHNWSSWVNRKCIEDAGFPEECFTPYDLKTEEIWGNENYASLIWNSGIYNNSILNKTGFTKRDSISERFKLNSSNFYEVIGYNIYRDGELLNEEIITDTTFLDGPIPWDNGFYCYRVTEVRTLCESEFSNESCVWFVDGLTEIEKKIHFYPNPVKNYLKIEAVSIIKGVKIFSIAGVEIISVPACFSNETELNLETLKQGIYIIHIETEEGSLQSKVIIQ